MSEPGFACGFGQAAVEHLTRSYGYAMTLTHSQAMRRPVQEDLSACRRAFGQLAPTATLKPAFVIIAMPG